MRLTKALFAVALIAATMTVAPGRAAAPALFHVGVAVRDITPCAGCPQYLGGFGYGDPVDGTSAHDPLQVRAMAIANDAGDMVLFAIVDSQGWFAGNQEGPWGSRDARIDAAGRIAALGYPVTEANVIVSSTHSHAAPSVMGIWGVTDPDYLKFLHDQTVASLVDAASNLKDAWLFAGAGDIATVTIESLTQTDGYQGWRAEGTMPVLWARDPVTGKTVGLYANVPTHADIVNGVGNHVISADHIGVERAMLDADLGGTAVVAMGTLGRQETIVQLGGLNQAELVGRFVTNEIERALASARPITDDTIAAAEQYALLPATNPALVALNLGNAAGDAAQPGVGDGITSHCVPGVDICTIDRAILPPYAVGASFGTWFTAFRIGDIAYASEPGEAFPEVSAGIRAAMGAKDVRIVGMAQDQLGYYYPPESYPFTFVNDSDHHIYNASLVLGDVNVQMHAVNGALLGFDPAVTHETNQFHDPGQASRAGVQFFPVVRESASPSVRFDAKTSSSALGGVSNGLLGEPNRPSTINWSFGDGTTATTGQGVITHTYAAPGTYLVTAVTVGSSGGSGTWKQTVIVDPPVSAGAYLTPTEAVATMTGGSGTLLAAHWSFTDGTSTDGIAVARPAGEGGTVTITDSAGNHATHAF